MSNQRLMNKLKDISVLLFTSRNGSPDTLTPAHTGLSACTLRDTAVNNRMANFSFAAVIGRLNSRLGQKTKIIFRSLALESSGQFLGKFMIGRAPHSPQKAFFYLFHFFRETFGCEYIAAMQGTKELFEPLEKLISPINKRLCRMFGKESNLSNQMCHTILNNSIRQTSELAIAAPVITADNAVKLFCEQIEQYPAAAGFINMKERIVRSLKTPRPVLLALVFMACLVNAKIRLVRQTCRQLVIRGFQRLRYLLRGFAEHTAANIQTHDFLKELPDSRERHVAAALHKSDSAGNIGSKQAAFANFVRHRRNMYFACDRVDIFSGSMFDNLVHLFRQLYLLNYKPFVQRFKAGGVFICKLVFNNFINLLGLKRGTRKLSVTVLSAAFAFLFIVCESICGLYNIARRRLGRIAGVLFQPDNLFFKFCDIYFHRTNFFFQQFYMFPQEFIFFNEFFDNGIFVLHTLFLPQRKQKRKLPILTFDIFMKNFYKFCERLLISLSAPPSNFSGSSRIADELSFI